MSDRSLFLLSPYRLPTNHQILLNEDEMAAWLNGFVVLWHPALLWGTAHPPSVASQYDHEQPTAGHVYAMPESPPLFLPDDWPLRVRGAGAYHFPAVADRADTLAHMLRALRDDSERETPLDPQVAALLELSLEQVQPFFSLGFGYLMVESLFDAMEHEHLLDVAGFWNEVLSAVAAVAVPERRAEAIGHLEAAAGKLQSARDVLYSSQMHVLDLTLVDEAQLDADWPLGLRLGQPHNVLGSAYVLERLRQQAPQRYEELARHTRTDGPPPNVEIIGAIYRDREDDLLPLESQLWNLRTGLARAKELLGIDVEVVARRRSAFHPQTPLVLHNVGLRRTLLIAFDDAVIPNHRASIVQWPSPDGKHVEAFARPPLPSHLAQTYFNLVYSLYQAITQDSAPTLALAHTPGQPPSPFYTDWLMLNQLGPVLGQWTTFSRYFTDALAGEYIGPAGADEFFSDHLERRVNAGRPDVVSAFARHARLRRRLDAIWTLAGLYRSLQATPWSDTEWADLQRLQATEDAVEAEGVDPLPLRPDDDPTSHPSETLRRQVLECEHQWAQRLAQRLQLRSPENPPGFLFLNPCSFTRRVVFESNEIRGPLPIEPPIRAAQFDDDAARLVVEIPPLGFAWIPRQGPPGTPLPRVRLKMADGTIVRNEYLEAEIDPQTGGLRAIRDPRTRIPRLGQQLVFNPGSRMQAKEVRITHNGSALGEIVSEGAILDEQNERLATFRQRFRAWLGRPILEIRIEIYPERPPTGYPWHAYYAARFAWRDDRATLIRGVNGNGSITGHTRPTTPDYLEVRLGRSSTSIYPCGLPFHQRNGSRMLDVILRPEKEEAHVFELGLGIDRDYPMQTAIGMVTPCIVVPTSKGPPPVGPSGWLMQIDRPNLLLTTLRPGELNDREARSIVLQLAECSAFGGSAEIRTARDPKSAHLLDGKGEVMFDLPIHGDVVSVDYSAGDLFRVRVDFP